MAENRLEELRQELNELILSEKSNSSVLLEKSRELDTLILQSIKAVHRTPTRKLNTGDEQIFQLDDLMEKLALVGKMYQAIRLVDPVEKVVLEYRENELWNEGLNCYHFWEKEEVCDNCISMRAYNEDDAVFKIECKGQSVYMAMAVPVYVMGRKLVMELLKDVTGKLITDNELYTL